MYADDYDGWSPAVADSVGAWAKILYLNGYIPHGSNTYVCPSYPPYRAGSSAQTYGRRSATAGNLGYCRITAHHVLGIAIAYTSGTQTPSEFIFMGDSKHENQDVQQYYLTNNTVHIRHSGRANILFADGHVESLDKAGLVEHGWPENYNVQE